MKGFHGFVTPTTTDTPNELFDIVLPRINNLAELKVVLYIIRRTFGFHKQMDWIALSQFERGIVTKDGQRLDDGVGLAHKSIVAGLERGVNEEYLAKQFHCPDCGTEVKGTRRARRTAHASKIVLPERCPACGGKIRGRVQVFYGLRWSGSIPVPPGAEVVPFGNYTSYQRELRVVTKGNTQSTTTTTTTTTGKWYVETDQICAVFARAIGVERYDPTEREQRQVAALLADGYSAEGIGAGIQRAVQLAATKGQKVRSLVYCIPEVRNPSVRLATEAETSERAAETDAGTPKPTAVAGKSPVETKPVARKLQIESEPTLLDVLANGNAELRDLLDVIQAKNSTRVLDRGDARAWLKLADDFADLAKERDTSPIGLVMQAVLEAIGANSNREGFLAPNLARRILERWHALREAITAKERAGEESTRVTVSPNNTATEPATTAWSDDDEEEPAQPQYSQTLAGVSPSNANDIWHGTLGELQLQMTRATFDTWVRPTRALGWEDGHDGSTPTLIVGVQSPYAKEWLEARLSMSVQRVATGIVGRAVEIRYVAPVPRDTAGSTTEARA